MENTKYKEVNGTSYHIETPDKLVEILERLRNNGTRIILDYGDPETGRSWGEVYDITGHLSRSCGQIKVPILIHNKRSFGGGSILDHCIIKISESKGKKVLYSINN